MLVSVRIKLNSDEIALAYNVNAAPNAAFGQVAWPGLRNPVAVSVSEDFGSTWPIGRTFDAAEGVISVRKNKNQNPQHEYPTLYQDSRAI